MRIGKAQISSQLGQHVQGSNNHELVFFSQNQAPPNTDGHISGPVHLDSGNNSQLVSGGRYQAGSQNPKGGGIFGLPNKPAPLAR